MYSERVAGFVRTYLDSQGWKYSFVEEDGVFQFGLNIRGNLRNVRHLIFIREDDYSVYAISPVSADSDNPVQMEQVMEFICRANYGLRDGNFEFDVDDGEIRFKTFVNCDGADASEEIVERSIQIPSAMFTRYGKGLLPIIFCDMSAREAIMLAEGDLFSGPSSDERQEDETSSADRLLGMLHRLQDDDKNRDEDAVTEDL